MTLSFRAQFQRQRLSILNCNSKTTAEIWALYFFPETPYRNGTIKEPKYDSG